MTTFTIATHYSGNRSLIVSVKDENEREVSATEAFSNKQAKHIAYGYAVLVTKTRVDDALVLDTFIPERPDCPCGRRAADDIALSAAIR